MSKVLIIGWVWPEPASSAAGSHMLELVQLFLAQNHKIVFASPAVMSEQRFDLTTLGVEEKSIALNCSSFDDYIRELQPDIVLFDRFHIEEQFGWRVAQACPDALRILDTEDFQSLRNARHQLLKKSQKLFATEKERQSVGPVLANEQELYAELCEGDMVLREVAAIFRCDLSLIISPFEMDFLQRNFSVPEQLLFYCPFLSSQSLPEYSLPDFADRQHFIAIGNFRHEPNWDSVLWLKHQLWPLIRKQLPQAELHIYGSYTPPKARQLHNEKEGFLIKDWAPNAQQVMQSARVCLAPLRFGAGMKGKLMDAMRCGTPSVTTSIGAEGMHGDLAWGGEVANTPEEFSAAAIALYQDQSLWQKKQSQAFKILNEFFGSKKYSTELNQRITELKKNIITERLRNFIGQMLMHHQHTSTRYMGQWIEAKNRQVN